MPNYIAQIETQTSPTKVYVTKTFEAGSTQEAIDGITTFATHPLQTMRQVRNFPSLEWETVTETVTDPLFYKLINPENEEVLHTINKP